MQELSARAALVPAPDVSDGLTTAVSREEVVAALGADGSPDLILDVTRFSDGDAAETRNIVVAWERGDLEELLRQSDGDQIVLTFDREAIQQAMEADVEAHGIREKALVLAVAALAATGAAANASAQGTSPDDRAVSQATSVGQAEIPYLSHGILTPEAAAAASGSANPDDRAVSMAAPDTGAASEAIAAEIPYLSHGTLTPEGAATGSSVGPDDRAVSMAAPAPADVAAAADGGISISAPSASTTAGIGAALALAITGAAFVVAGRRRMTPAS